jgi:uncharacterized protein YndB with AHSA1/START domain
MLAGKNIEVKADLPSELEIAFTCRLQRSAHLLFEAWTKPEHLRQWSGCEGSRITHCAIDLRVGGSWSLVMQMKDGSDHPFHGTYREIVRPRRLIYTECYDMPQFGRPEWLSTVTFDETQGATLVTLLIQHKSRSARDGHLQAGMQEGVVQTLTRLYEHTAAMERLS